MPPKPSDPQINTEYLMEMYQNLLSEETNLKPLFGYMKKKVYICDRITKTILLWILTFFCQQCSS